MLFRSMVLVNLPSAFANKTGTLQFRRYEKGVLRYRNLGEVVLNESGNATYRGEKPFLKGTRFRLIVDDVITAYATARY